MGQALKKFGSDERKKKEIGPVLEECYQKYFVNTKDWTVADFYHAVCSTVEEINRKIGSTQFHVPKKSTLEEAYQVWKFKENPLQASALGIKLLLDVVLLTSVPIISVDGKKHHQGKGKDLTKEEFQKILQDVIMDTGVTGIGAKDTLMYIFGIPVTALFFKQRLIPTAIPNEIFIPGVTSAAVFLLAKLNKI